MTDDSADPSSSLSSCARSEAQRIREHEIRRRMQDGGWIADWDDMSWLLQRSEEARETIATKERTIGELLQSVSARTSERDEARRLMEWLDVQRAKHVDRADDAEEALAAAKQELETANGRVEAWRQWAQFVYFGGGTPIGNDRQLRQGICEVQDEHLAAARLRATPQEQDENG